MLGTFPTTPSKNASYNGLEFKIYDTFLNTCSYLKGWLSATDKDKREETLKNAFIEASTAKKYLTNI